MASAAMRKNSAILLYGATLGAQLILLVATVLLAKLYKPDVFGLHQLHLSLFMIAAVVACWRYEQGVFACHDFRDATQLLRLTTLLCIVTSALVAVVIQIAGVISIGRVASAPFLLWSLPIAVLFGGIAQAHIIAFTRFSRLDDLALARVVQASVFSITALLIAIFVPIDSGLVIADVAARGMIGGLLLYLWTRQTKITWPSWSELHRVEMFHRRAALLGAPGALLNAIGGLMTPIVIFSLYGSAAAGQYALVDRMLLAPVALLTQTTAQIVVGRLSSARHDDPRAFRLTFQRVTAVGIAVGIVATGFVGIAAAPLLLLVFGDTWQASARFATILAPMFVVLFAAAPVSHTLIIAGQHKQQFGWEVLRFCAIACCWTVVGATAMNLEDALRAYVWTTVLIYGVFLLLSFRASARIVSGD